MNNRYFIDNKYVIGTFIAIFFMFVGMLMSTLIGRQIGINKLNAMPTLSLLLGILPVQGFAFGGLCVWLYSNSNYSETSSKAINSPWHWLVCFNLHWEDMSKMVTFVKDVCIALLVFLPLSILTTQLFLFFLKIFFHYKAKPQEIVTDMLKNDDIIYWLLCIIITCIVAPITEEIIFRLTINEAIKALSIPAIFSAILTATIFATIHFSITAFPALFMLGIILQYLRSKHHSLWPTIFLHAFSNSVSIAGIILLKILHLNP